jgi:C4-dicarboxylate-specific signal transduction histidine kinase
MKRGVLLSIGALFFAVMMLGSWVSLRWARSIFSPVERMAQAMARFTAGDGAARVGTVGTGDELSALALHLDALLTRVDEKARELQTLNQALDAKVAERTLELQTAQQQMVRSEKLAAVGQLTAGIAHEVNNPIAVIQGNLDLLRERLGAQARPAQRELQLIDEQIERMRLIVTRLLQFSRPSEYAGYLAPLDVQQLVNDSLVLVDSTVRRSGVRLSCELHSQAQPGVNRQELQQVLVNLLLNAVDAMPDGGTLTLRSADLREGDREGLALSVLDTGPGLPPRAAEELFKPFVTHKKDGTGLGLWISRSIVERYGGDLRAADRDDGQRGAVFTVWLPV